MYWFPWCEGQSDLQQFSQKGWMWLCHAWEPENVVSVVIVLHFRHQSVMSRDMWCQKHLTCAPCNVFCMMKCPESECLCKFWNTSFCRLAGTTACSTRSLGGGLTAWHKRSSISMSLGNSLQNCLISGDNAFTSENGGLQLVSTQSRTIFRAASSFLAWTCSCLSMFWSKASLSQL